MTHSLGNGDHMRMLFVSFFTAWLAACSENAANQPPTVAIDTLNGVEHIRIRGEPPVWTLNELITLGATVDVETGGAQEFARISGVLADAQHNIYVADARALNIRVFDENGRLLRILGRKGAGPAEFGILQSIGWLGDTIVIMDPGNARLGFLTPSGEWRGQRPFDRITGNLRLMQTSPAELYSMAFKRDGNRAVRAYVRQIPSGQADTMLAPIDLDRRSKAVECSYKTTGGDAITFYSVDFAPGTVKQPAPNVQRLEYWNAEYKLSFLNAANDTVRVIERELPPLTVDDSEWAREEAAFRSWYENLPPTRTCANPGLPRPPAKAMIRGVFWDDQNRMWVERRTSHGFDFDVFAANGELLAQLAAPARLETVPIHIRGDRLYVATTDSLDVQYVKAFQIAR